MDRIFTWFKDGTGIPAAQQPGGPTSTPQSPVCVIGIDAGATVTLTATAAAGSRFTGWSGACAGSGQCIITMDQSRSVTATLAVARTMYLPLGTR